MSDDVQFKDQVVWVTGAGSGIGRAVAERFLRAGARVALMARRRDALEAAVRASGAPPERAAVEPLDVSERAAVDQASERLLKRWGRVDVLVNNAGTNVRDRALVKLSDADWDRVIAVNLTGAYHLVRAVLPPMRAAGGGLIVNVASIAGKWVNAFSGAAYAASKHGMVGLSHTINEEEWRNNIRACAICPGEVATELLDKRKLRPPEADVARMIQPEDLAELVATVAALPARATVTEMIVLPTYRRKMQPGEL